MGNSADLLFIFEMICNRYIISFRFNYVIYLNSTITFAFISYIAHYFALQSFIDPYFR